MKQYKFKINGNDYNVAINSTNGNLADVTVNGVSYQVEMENSMPAAPAAAPVQAAPQASAPAPQPAAAKEVAAFLQTEEAIQVFEKYGFARGK